MKTLALILLLPLVACEEAEPGAQSYGEASGESRYADAKQAADGSEHDAARPEPGPVDVQLRLSGEGEMSLVDPQCALDATGSAFDGRLYAEGEVDADGGYLAVFGEQELDLESAAGCALSGASLESTNSVVLWASFEATAERCSAYCEADSRARAESECEGDADQASCRAEVEAEQSVACEQTCTEESAGIAAVAELEASVAGSVAEGMMSGAGFGSIEVELQFDRMEDQDGERIER